MKALARAQGLWNLWISPHLAACMAEAVPDAGDRALLGAGLSNLVRRHRSPPCRTLQTLQTARNAGVAEEPDLPTKQTGWPLSAAKPSRNAVSVESHVLCCGGAGVRLPQRADGPRGLCLGGLQLLGPRHRQHGGPGQVSTYKHPVTDGFRAAWHPMRNVVCCDLLDFMACLSCSAEGCWIQLLSD